MKNYVLVHGAWGGAWEFETVVKLLSADDSNVLAVDLPGHGNHKAPITEVTMNAYVQKITDVIHELDEKVILVGHSLAGSVISQVAENIPQKIDRLIYVAAFLPKNGDTPIGLLQNDEGSELIPKLIFSEDQSFVTLREGDIAYLLLHDVEDEARLEGLVSRLAIEQAVEPLMAAARLSDENFGTVPKYFIRANLDRVMSFPLQSEMIANWNVEQVFTLESGHFPLTSMPERLVEVIIKASADAVNTLRDYAQAA